MSLPCSSATNDIVMLAPRHCGSASVLEGVSLTLLHELGHYFGLLHAFDATCISQDSPLPCTFPHYDGPAPVLGDGFRDTVSDPDSVLTLASLYTSCGLVFTAAYRNVMSYYGSNTPALATFPGGQIRKMEHYAPTERAHVLSSAGGSARRR